MRAVVVAALAVVGAAGCKSGETSVRESFAKDYSCPMAGVTATTRDEVSAYDVTIGKSVPPSDERAKARRKFDANNVLVVAKGCSLERFYLCGRNGRACRETTAP